MFEVHRFVYWRHFTSGTHCSTCFWQSLNVYTVVQTMCGTVWLGRTENFVVFSVAWSALRAVQIRRSPGQRLLSINKSICICHEWIAQFNTYLKTSNHIIAQTGQRGCESTDHCSGKKNRKKKKNTKHNTINTKIVSDNVRSQYNSALGNRAKFG